MFRAFPQSVRSPTDRAPDRRDEVRTFSQNTKRCCGFDDRGRPSASGLSALKLHSSWCYWSWPVPRMTIPRYSRTPVYIVALLFGLAAN